MVKFLVYGSQGWIGQQVVSYMVKHNINHIEAKTRVDNTSECFDEINQIQPTHIICLIGRTHGSIGDKQYTTIDYLEQPGKLVDNIRDNLFSPLSLALKCQTDNIHLTYLGTGCIFKYDEDHDWESGVGFDETDIPNFFDSSYSVVKGFTDRLMHQLSSVVLNLRIRMPITSTLHPRNFITKITSYEKICSAANSMTVLDELIPLAIDMAQRGEVGTINLCNPGTITHNEILEMYKEIVDPDFTWKNFTYEEQMEILAAGRSNNYLTTSRLEDMYNVLNINESVRHCLVKMVRDNNQK